MRGLNLVPRSLQTSLQSEKDSDRATSNSCQKYQLRVNLGVDPAIFLRPKITPNLLCAELMVIDKKTIGYKDYMRIPPNTISDLGIPQM